MTSLLILAPNPKESASERYRVYQFLPYFERAGFKCTVRPFATRALHRAIQQDRLAPKLLLTPLGYLRRAFDLSALSKYDAVIIHRGLFPFPWPAVERMIVRRHPKVIFDFDDAIHIGHRDVGMMKYPWIYKFKYGPGVNELLSHCTHVIAGNRTLAEHALQFNGRVSIIPTVIDLNQYTYRPPRDYDLLTIGWVGSRSTSPYLSIIEPALRKLSDTHPSKIRFRLYGHPERKLNLPDFQSLPFSLASEVEDLRNIDIGIMPVPDNEWTRGKCAFKAIQYMAAGIPTVVSPVGMTSELVEHNVNGFCAETPEQWFQALDHLVADFHTRLRFSQAARKTIEERYSLQAWGPRFSELIQEILESTPAPTLLSAMRVGS